MFTFKPMEELPRRNRGRKDMDARLNAFMQLKVKAAEVVGWENSYKNVVIACSVLRASIGRRKLPIKVSIVSGKLYFVRTDM